MAQWITNTMNAMGYGGIVLLMFLENVFPPIPSETIMLLAGFATTQGKLSLVGVSLAGMIGSVLGALPFYFLGKAIGEERIKVWADKYGKWLAMSGDDIEKANKWFNRHGSKVVFLCRMVPTVRSLISIPAGIYRMNLAVFLLYTALGTGLWAALLACLGYLLGENYTKVDQYLGSIAYAVLGLVVIALTIRVVKRRKQSVLIVKIIDGQDN
jgi:membrane protein DedA with SNARE-associated domain